tara:strand:- start:2112 stop:2966 length:855 start_codon:yes stop_codon:yes gene_type:complete
MTILQSNSPTNLEFNPRHPSFNLIDSLKKDWHGDSAFRTAWYNALSMLFPIGEKFFIDSVLHFKKEITDPKLLNEIKNFQGQEAIHRLQHQQYNELLCELRGYDLEAFEEPLRKRMSWVQKNLSPRRRLAGTAAAEHLTAIMAHRMLTKKDSFIDADQNIAKLWYWHGIEETEHKSVAYDVYCAVGGTIHERRRALLVSTFFLYKDVFRNIYLILKKDGKLWNLKEWMSGFKFMFITPGVIPHMIIPWLKYFRKSFHPWNMDNRHLIKQWEDGHFDNPSETMSY